MKKTQKPHGNTGRPCSEEKKAKIRAALRGRKLGPYPPERGAAISAAKKGKPMTEAQHRAHQAAVLASKGRTPWNKGLSLPPLSPEHREKLSLVRRGKVLSEQTRLAMSRARKGMRFSEEHRVALSEAAKQRWARGDVFAFRSRMERQVGWLLKPYGFTAQFRIDGYAHPFDYGNAEARLLIEVNGCFWHAHDCGARIVDVAVRERDAKQRCVAEESGYRVITLWQCEEAQWPVILQHAGVFERKA